MPVFGGWGHGNIGLFLQKGMENMSSLPSGGSKIAVLWAERTRSPWGSVSEIFPHLCGRRWIDSGSHVHTYVCDREGSRCAL